MSGAVPAASDPIGRRAMFVLELVDPVTQLPVGGSLDVNASVETSAEALRAPGLTRAGQLVWLDLEPPAVRSIRVSATTPARDFAPYEEVLAIAQRTDGTPPTLVRRNLRPTGLYRPPAGRLAAAGMLIDDKAVGARNPVADAQLMLVLDADALGTELRSSLIAVTDARGGFVAVAKGFGTQVPQPAPRPALDGSVAGRLEVTWQGATRKSVVTLRQAQLNYLPEPIAWADLTP